MKPAVFNHLRLTLAVLVLAAAAVDLLLPSPHCADSELKSGSISVAEKTAACAAALATAGNGLREP
ncbi:MAG: hypothetical protein ABWX88_09115 [Pseudoxanthomonas sp.]